MDIGANHPIKSNNTYWFEEHGWTGLAFEPQPDLAELWSKFRKTECLNIALGACEEEVEFAEAGGENAELSGCVGTIKVERINKKYFIKQRTLTNVLNEKGINKIDFCSIDVEGYEMNVLEGIDFDNIFIECLCIENNKRHGKYDKRLRKYLENKGYRFVARISIDDIFVKK